MIRSHGKYLAACLLIVSCSCSDFGPDNSGKVVVSTNKSSYGTLQKITFTVQNLSEPTAYMWHCNYRLTYGVQMQDNGTWSTIRDRHWGCVAIYVCGAMPVPFGQPYTDTLSLYVPGVYRLDLDVGWDPNHISEHQIYSNTFKVE